MDTIPTDIKILEQKIDKVVKLTDKCNFGGDVISLMNDIGGIRYKYLKHVYLKDGTKAKDILLETSDKLKIAMTNANSCDCSISDRRNL